MLGAADGVRLGIWDSEGQALGPVLGSDERLDDSLWIGAGRYRRTWLSRWCRAWNVRFKMRIARTGTIGDDDKVGSTEGLPLGGIDSEGAELGS